MSEHIHKKSDETAFTDDDIMSSVSFDDDTPEPDAKLKAAETGAQRARLDDLNTRLILSPDSSTLYLLRGELFMSRRKYYLAHADFLQAITLARAALPESAWGFVEQSVLDRTQQHLKHLTRYMDT